MFNNPLSTTNKNAGKFDMFTRATTKDDRPLSLTGRSTPQGVKNAFYSQIDRFA